MVGFGFCTVKTLQEIQSKTALEQLMLKYMKFRQSNPNSKIDKQATNLPESLLQTLVTLWGPQARFDKAVQLMLKVQNRGEKALLFTKSKRLMELFSIYLMLNHKINVLKYDGTSNTMQKKDMIQKFKEGPVQNFLFINIQSGGLGLNLQCANNVIFLDLWWRGTFNRSSNTCLLTSFRLSDATSLGKSP